MSRVCPNIVRRGRSDSGAAIRPGDNGLGRGEPTCSVASSGRSRKRDAHLCCAAGRGRPPELRRQQRRLGSEAEPAAKFKASSAEGRFDVRGDEVRQRLASRKSDPSLLGRTDSTRVNVMVKYDFDATASYTGGVAGSRGDEPARDGQVAEGERRPRCRRTTATRPSCRRRSRAAAKKAAPGLKVAAAVPHGLRRRRGLGAGEPDRRAAARRRASPRCRRTR